MSLTDRLGKGRGGFTMVEVLPALALLCVGLLALFSCFGTGVLSDIYAAERTEAVRLAQTQMEAVTAMCFDDVSSKTVQVTCNGKIYTCDIIANGRPGNPYLKDVTVTVSWTSRRPARDAAEQVQLATTVLRR